MYHRRRLILVLITGLLIAGTPASAADGGNSSVAVLLNRGDRLFRSMNNAGALEAYREAEKLAPTDYGVLVRLTRVNNDIGRVLLRKSPDAESYYRNAIAYAERLRAQYPDSAETWFYLALCHGSLVPFKSLGEKLELSRDVRANAERALAIDSSFAMAHVILGIYYRAVARLGWFERTIVNGILGKNLGGTYEDAEQHLHRAVALEPENPYAHFELSWVYRAMGRTDDAKAELQKVLTIPPTCQREQLQHDDAERMLQRLASGTH